MFNTAKDRFADMPSIPMPELSDTPGMPDTAHLLAELADRLEGARWVAGSDMQMVMSMTGSFAFEGAGDISNLLDELVIRLDLLEEAVSVRIGQITDRDTDDLLGDGQLAKTHLRPLGWVSECNRYF